LPLTKSLDPPEPRTSGATCNFERKRPRRAWEREWERKSFELKSITFWVEVTSDGVVGGGNRRRICLESPDATDGDALRVWLPPAHTTATSVQVTGVKNEEDEVGLVD